MFTWMTRHFEKVKTVLFRKGQIILVVLILNIIFTASLFELLFLDIHSGDKAGITKNGRNLQKSYGNFDAVLLSPLFNGFGDFVETLCLRVQFQIHQYVENWTIS